MPFGQLPGASIGYDVEILNEIDWDAYQWNPPQYLVDRYPDPDPNASRKPTWADIVAARDVQLPIYLRQQHTAALSAECKTRITRAYGANDWQDEIEMRLRGESTDEHDTERARLRAIYAVQKIALGSMTVTQLKAFNPSDDGMWV